MPGNALQRFSEKISQNRSLCFAFFFFFSSVVLPYQGICHDARLYAFQVLNLVKPEFLIDDLYLKFGSQDKFTLFSYLAFPLVKFCGLKLGFFLLFIVGKIILIAGSLYLASQICTNPLAALLGSGALLLNALPYSNLDIFQINEPFTTPRLFAEGLSLWALGAVLQRRLKSASLLFIASLSLHVLSALPAIGFALIYGLTSKFGQPKVWGSLIVGALAISFITLAPLSFARFSPELDLEWRELILKRAPYLFIQNWSAHDWGRVALFLSALLLSARILKEQRRNLALSSILLAILGIIFAFLGSNSDSSLLLQLQSYRAFWLVIVLALLLAAELVSKLLQSEKPQHIFWGFVGLAMLGIPEPDFNSYFLYRLAFCLFILLIFAISLRGLRSRARNIDWLQKACTVSLPSALIWLWCFILVVGFSEAAHEFLPGEYQALFRRSVFFSALCGGMTLPIIFASIFNGCLAKRRPNDSVLISVLVFLGVLVQLMGYSRNEIALMLSRAERTAQRKSEFVARQIEASAARLGTKALSVYWPFHLEDIWFELGATSFYSAEQLAGLSLNRANAIEGKRRADVVASFEQDSYCSSPSQSRGLSWAYPPDLCARAHTAPNTLAILHLCQSEKIDIVVLDREFEADSRIVRQAGVSLVDCQKFRS